MENITFVGTDESLEISLLEYGLIISNEEHEDGSGTHFCVYRMAGPFGEDCFGTSHMSEKQINGYILGTEFMSSIDIEEFLSWSGTSDANEWIQLPLVTKIHELIEYWGVENIFGTEYAPMTEHEACVRYLNYNADGTAPED